jgi:heme/copper-type cytochrome/quinol oxidase subunit 2
MRKIKKGNTGFIVGLIVYIFLSIMSLGSGILMLNDASNARGMEEQTLMILGFSMITIFICITLWFISFATAFRQRKTQIELLEELTAQGMGDSIIQ